MDVKGVQISRHTVLWIVILYDVTPMMFIRGIMPYSDDDSSDKQYNMSNNSQTGLILGNNKIMRGEVPT